MTTSSITVIRPTDIGNTNHRIDVGSATFEVYGLGGDDYIWTSAGNDILFGGSGWDIVWGWGGNDLILGDNASDGLDGINTGTGFVDLDNILGGAGDDIIYAQTGNDYVNGEDGEDIIFGGFGNDFLQGGDNGDHVHGGEGDDTIVGDFIAAASGAYTFSIDLRVDGNTNAPLNPVQTMATSLGSSSVIDGDPEDDLHGGAGDDIIFGGPGFDLLYGDEGNDRLDGGASGDFLYGGDGNDYLYGGAGAGGCELHGEAGNDRLVSETNSEILDGGSGNDFFVLGANTPAVIMDTAGVDTISSTISRSLVAYLHTGINEVAIENLVLLAGVSGTGNALANSMTGNASNNRLTGLGNADILTGRGGNDTFVYENWFDSRAAHRDTIKDFDDSGNDRIDLSAIYIGALTWRGAGAFSGTGQVRIHDIAGPDVLVEVNLGGSLAPEMIIRLANTTPASMTASDFIF